MHTLSLKEIAKGIGAEAVKDALLSGISIDSRAVEKGDLYIAIKGENFDGHDFSKSAVENGAAAVMCHKDIDVDCPKIIVNDTQEAFLSLASWYRDTFSFPVIGLTGSVGKTTTKEMICAALSSELNTLKTEGNLNNQIGVPKTLMRLNSDFEAAVIEMGMDNKGQISVLSRCVKPTAAVITNIGVSHMENLGSREGILAAKLEILEGLSDGAPVFLNGDDPYLMSAQIENHPVIYYGINNSICKYKAENIVPDGTSTSFEIHCDGDVYNVRIPTIGKHNVYNAVAAFAVAKETGIAPENAIKGLLNYEPSGMRQRINQKGGVTFIEDCYNASPDSVRAAINTLASFKTGRRVAVLGDMLELGTVSDDAHRDSGMLAAKKGIDAVFTYGEKSVLTSMKAQEMGISETAHFTSHEALAERINAYIKPDDVVLFKASRGMKLENVIELVYKNLK
ncbi:MAG: UDP-N-acetylmuramoyl-tripeptide--D-alanyl-D-alanine ligase [Clostridia bacterium]|nr:UDP-N-acetylmuramoyl-tripeptide--D-alanyl-D-alanine ligase [Clostridia bacterium]